MKTKNKFMKMIFPAGMIILLSACYKEHCENKPPAQPETQTLSALEINYGKAKTYNDSLEMCHNGAIAYHDSITEQYYDSQYHYYDSLMQQHHDKCHAQQNSGSNGMMGGGMMGNGASHCNCFSESNDFHSQTDALQKKHLQFHGK